MAGLDPAIFVDHRVKPGDDGKSGLTADPYFAHDALAYFAVAGSGPKVTIAETALSGGEGCEV
jgi:hypothetical protein